MAELLPFGPGEPFTFVDLGAGTGAAARTVLDHFPAARAILADSRMMAQGVAELAPYEGRYSYVEFDLTTSGGWPSGIPAPVDAVISSLSVHHLKDDRKQSVFREIHDQLRRAVGISTTTRLRRPTRWRRRPGCVPGTGVTRPPRTSEPTGPLRSSSATRTTSAT